MLRFPSKRMDLKIWAHYHPKTRKDCCKSIKYFTPETLLKDYFEGITKAMKAFCYAKATSDTSRAGSNYIYIV